MSRSEVALIAALLMPVAGSPAVGDGTPKVIDQAMRRVVKLYGLGVGREVGYGSGIVISEDGLVATVLSILIDGRTIRAVAWDGRRYEAEVLHRDTARQLAFLRLKSTGEATSSQADVLPCFRLASDIHLTSGDWVWAPGNPFKLSEADEPLSVMRGVVSTQTRLDATRGVKDFPYHGDVLVIDAITSNPGAPGSALINLDGDLVGMIGRVVRSNLTSTNLNYAIPVEVIRQALADATRSEPGAGAAEPPPAVADLGIRFPAAGFQKVLPFVERVRRESPAAKAGVRADDLILAVHGRNVDSVEEYTSRLKAIAPGDAVELVIRRGRSILNVRVETGIGKATGQQGNEATRP